MKLNGWQFGVSGNLELSYELLNLIQIDQLRSEDCTVLEGVVKHFMN